MQAIFCASNDLLMKFTIRDGMLRVLHASSSFAALLGHEVASLRGDARKLNRLFLAEDFDNMFQHCMDDATGSEIVGGRTWEQALVHRNGHLVWFEHKVLRLHGESSVFFLMSREITDRRARQELELALTAEREAAAERELRVAAAQRRADSALNHIVKNQCGQASIRLQARLSPTSPLPHEQHPLPPLLSLCGGLCPISAAPPLTWPALPCLAGARAPALRGRRPTARRARRPRGRADR